MAMLYPDTIYIALNCCVAYVMCKRRESENESVVACTYNIVLHQAPAYLCMPQVEYLQIYTSLHIMLQKYTIYLLRHNTDTVDTVLTHIIIMIDMYNII